MEAPLRLMVVFSILKFVIVQLKRLKAQLTEEELLKHYPGKDWGNFINKSSFKDFNWEVDH